jgi:hypothetical protein
MTRERLDELFPALICLRDRATAAKRNGPTTQHPEIPVCSRRRDRTRKFAQREYHTQSIRMLRGHTRAVQPKDIRLGEDFQC